MHVSVPFVNPARGLRAQLRLALGLLVAVLLGSLGLTSWQILAIRQEARQAIEIDARLSHIANDVALQMLQCRRFEKDFLLNLYDRATRAQHRSQWSTAHQALMASIDTFAAAASSTDDQVQAATWREQSGAYVSAFLAVEQRIDAGELVTPQQANEALAPSRDLAQALTDSSISVAARKAEAVARSNESLIATSTSALTLVVLVAIATLLAAGGWLLIVPARLTQPLAALHAATSALARGDLAARVMGPARHDEVGQIATTFNQMAATVQERTDALQAQNHVAEEARAVAEQAQQRLAEQLATIEQQRAIIQEMSVPVLPISPAMLVMPLIGVLDAERLDLIQREALRALHGRSARHMILDITGVPIIDTYVARGLIDLAKAMRLLGASVVVVGIRPEIAQSLVGLGVQFDLITCSTLQEGIAFAERQQRER
jgi:anti-anti-sigma regulatory factor/HAMP domain-containing protein